MRKSRLIIGILLALSLIVGACRSGEATSDTDLAGVPAADPEQPADEVLGREAPDVTTPGVLAVATGLDRKVIRTAQLELTSPDTRRTFDEITAVVEAAGGYVANATQEPTARSEDHPLISLEVRIPAAAMTTTLGRIEQLADEVTRKSIGSQDVTEEFTDLEAQLTNLRALEVELRDLLSEVRSEDKADANELLLVFDQIRQTRDEIERLEGRRQLLADLVSLATVRITLTPSAVAEPIVTGWQPLAAAKDALRGTVAALQNLADGIIWVGLFLLPILAVVLIPVGGATWLAWRIVRRRRPVGAATGPEPGM